MNSEDTDGEKESTVETEMKETNVKFTTYKDPVSRVKREWVSSK